MRIAFICDTAYQVFNALNYASANMAEEIDLYVGHQFHQSQEIAKRVREEKVFANVYGFFPPFVANTLKGKINRILRIAVPKKTVQQQLEQDEDISGKAYDKIFMSLITHFSSLFAFMYPKAEIYFFDDGTGSYDGCLGVRTTNKVNRLMYRLLGKDLNRLIPKATYLNNPAFAKKVEGEVNLPLPSLTQADELFWQRVRRVWAYRDDGYYASRQILLLTQPADDQNASITEQALRNVLEKLMPYKDICLARPHPRQKDVNTGDIPKDDHRDMWELVCANQIKDSHILISSYSTSQILPKMLYDKEPIIICYFGIEQEMKATANFAGMGQTIQRVRAAYRHPERVMCPARLDDFDKAIADALRMAEGLN